MFTRDFMLNNIRRSSSLASVGAEMFPPDISRPAVAAAPVTSPSTPRELTAEQREIVAEVEVENRLRSAMQRQIERVRPGATAAQAIDEQVINELRRSDSDSVELGLAKSMARLLVKQLGPAKSAAAIERVRDLRDGRYSGVRHGGATSPARQGRVLGAAPRR